MRQHTFRSRPELGFTMLELLVVVAIAAVILGLGVPSLRDWMIKQRVASVASEMATDLRYARSEALGNNMYGLVRVMPNGKGCYVVFRSTSPRLDQCDCTLPAGAACAGGGAVELKHVVMPLTGEVVIAPPAALGDMAGVTYRSGSEVTQETFDQQVFRISDGTAAREVLVTTAIGLARPTICTASTSKIAGFKSC